MVVRRSGADRRGISPVVGVVLMVLLLVMFGGVTGVMFLGISDGLSAPAPAFVYEEEQIDVGIQNGSIVTQDLLLSHNGGDPIHIGDLEVQVDNGAGTTSVTPSSTGDVADGVWSVGDELPIPLEAAEVCDGSNQLDLTLVHHGEGSYVVGERTVPVARGGFTVQDGSLVPISEYTADAEVLGTGFTYGESGPNIDIRLAFTIGETVYTPWPGNVNNNGNPRSHTFADQPPGAPLNVAATGDENGVYIAPRTRWSNATDGWVSVLRDGDDPPNIGAFGDQESAASYVQPYLDSNGKVSLSDNQAIFLFELGNSQTGPAADFQDVVVLVSLQTVETTEVTTDSTGRTVVVCSAN